MRGSLVREDRSAFPRWPFVVLLTGLIIAGGSIVATPLVEGLLARRGTAATGEQTREPVRASVAGIALTIPRDFVRFDDQKRGGDLARVDLVFRWPSLEPARDVPAIGPGGSIRQSPDRLSDLIFLSILPKDDALDPVQRFSGIYQRFLKGEARVAPDGLVGRRFAANSGYDGEELFYDAVQPASFFVRCAPSPDEGPAICLREVRLAGKIDVVYRLPRPMLGDWRKVEQAVQALLAAIGAPQR